MTFGERLKALRQKRHMTQKELSKALFISERVISYYEQNERFPNDAMTLIRIAQYFHVSVDYLLDMPPVQETDLADGMYPLSPDLLELIALYKDFNEYDKGRILQFALDLHDMKP
ncbi:MAG: helix-turn-helix transcriptional regulator [Lachnospiraceae bacterium]|nr:helix-turn-helix transcriptional regulator [Lachnospiraceae bacterium]